MGNSGLNIEVAGGHFHLTNIIARHVIITVCMCGWDWVCPGTPGTPYSSAPDRLTLMTSKCFCWMEWVKPTKLCTLLCYNFQSGDRRGLCARRKIFWWEKKWYIVMISLVAFWMDLPSFMCMLSLWLDCYSDLTTKIWCYGARSLFHSLVCIQSVHLRQLIRFLALIVFFYFFFLRLYTSCACCLLSCCVVRYTVSEQVGVHSLPQGEKNKTCSWVVGVATDRGFIWWFSTQRLLTNYFYLL